MDQVFHGDEGKKEKFLADAAECMNRIGEACKENKIHFAVRNEYWTLVRGTKIDSFMENLDTGLVSYAADPAHLSIANADYLEYFKKYAKQAKAVCFTDTKFEDELDVYKTISPEFPRMDAGREYIMTWDMEIWILLKYIKFCGMLTLTVR